MTGNTPAPTAVNNNCAALASVSVNVMNEGTRHSAILQAGHGRHTTSNFVYEGTSIAQEHIERDGAVKALQLNHVGGMPSTGSTVQAWLSSFRSCS